MLMDSCVVIRCTLGCFLSGNQVGGMFGIKCMWAKV